MISKILVASDDSDIANKAFTYTVDFAGQIKASITLLTVIDNRAFVAQSVPTELSHKRIVEPIEEYLRTSAEKYFKRAGNICREKGVTFQGIVRNGHPVEEIIKEAEKENADMIVMGSHGKGALTSAVLGSVTYGVIHRDTKFPVLVIR